jgi:hypothetical protein
MRQILYILIIQVALRKTGEAAAFCAGSLISDTRVVLAAQCLEK